nr:MAG TPA: hypothetical protein [Caudoviricetes sp.]
MASCPLFVGSGHFFMQIFEVDFGEFWSNGQKKWVSAHF